MKIKTNTTNIGSKGYFSLSVRDKEGNKINNKSIDNSPNVVTYAGAYRILFQDSSGLFGDYKAAIGTGTTEITRENTSLNNVAHQTSSTADASRQGNEVDNGDGTSTLTLTRSVSFPLSGTIGTFSEVGLYYGSTFVAGQLIKDEFGNPTTITILDEEELTVTYTLEFTFPNRGLSVAPTIGTGTVTTPEGSSTYTVYSTPFFRKAAINDSNEQYQFYGQAAWLANSSGNRISGNLVNLNVSYSHDGFGTVTATTDVVSASPSDINTTDLAYMSFSYVSGAPSASYGIDTTTKYANEGNGVVSGPIVEFSPPLIKDENRSISIQLQTVYSI